MKLQTKRISLSLSTTIFLNLKRGHYKAEFRLQEISFLNIQLHSKQWYLLFKHYFKQFCKNQITWVIKIHKTWFIIIFDFVTLPSMPYPKKTRQIFIYNFLFPWIPKEFFLVKKFEFRLTSIIFLLSDYFPQLNGERSTHCTFTTCSTIFFLFCSATYIIVCIHRLSHFSTLLIFPSFIKKKTQIFLSNF